MRQERILEILEEIRPDSDFMNSTDYIEDYLLDSLNIMTLIAMLEDEFQVKIPFGDIVPKSFTSLDEINELVNRNRAVL